MFKSSLRFIALLFLCCLFVIWRQFGGGKGFQVVHGKPAIVSYRALERVVRYIPGGDASTFKALESAKDAQAIYAVDAKRAYISFANAAMPIKSAHPDSFSIVTPDGAYAKDQDRVYWFGVEIQEADPDSFQVLIEPYTRDNDKAYSGTTPIKVHSLENFAALEVHAYDRPIVARHGSLTINKNDDMAVLGWARDGISYYWGSTEILGADYDSFKILNGFYARDKDAVYFEGKPLSGADAESFLVVGPGDIKGRDKNYEYELGERTGRVKRPDRN